MNHKPVPLCMLRCSFSDTRLYFSSYSHLWSICTRRRRISGTHQTSEVHKLFDMSYHNDPYNNAGDYSNTRRRSLQPLESQQELTEPPAPPNTVNVNQEIAHHYAAYRPQASIDESTTYYSTGTSNPGHYGTAHQYQQEHGSGYHPHTQGAMTIPYPPGQSARDVYSQHGVNAQWTSGHHYPSVDFHRSASWPPQHIGHSGLPMPLVRVNVIRGWPVR
ncbi:hypothetical protein BDM02DRAFT_1238207 [Thelephora ganbajun]|uniref:Uncharacterized protein n=1 Tax=Thelephora ganbajun TaxID=370292 RepID=A0ACB6Z2R8_THEGA|nr:hypothetical protein BDM02DRAFT_1238207 [Thelephora ganbajun]